MAHAPSALSPYRPLLWLAGVVLVAATLFWAQAVLVPFIFAVLLTFILSPIVSFLQARAIPRVPATLLVVVLTLFFVGAIGMGLGLQIKRLGAELPTYKANIRQKVVGIRTLVASEWLENLQDMFRDVAGSDVTGDDKAATEKDASPQTPASALGSGLSDIGTWARPAVESLAELGLVVVLVIFMLIQRESLRNRLVQLVPHGRLMATTRAFTETAERLSRFLLMQLLVNAGYGLVVGVGLAILGLPYPLVWGILTAFLRYLPYVGTALAVGFITLFAVAVFPGWVQPILVIVFFVVIELSAANVIEPLLFGHTAGVAPLALLVAVAFWSWLWGPAGLVLSTPLTVCLMVLGRHVPGLEFLGILLGDEPAADSEINFYQRLLARDQDEATGLVEEFIEANPPDTLFDRMLVPALNLARSDRESDELSLDAEQYVYRAIRDIVNGLAVSPTADVSGSDESASTSATARSAPLVLGCPARDEADELTLRMLAQLLEPLPCRFEVVPTGTLAAEVVARVRRDSPVVVCIAAPPPGGIAQSAYLCKRLRPVLPGLQIIVGVWGADSIERLPGRLLPRSACQIVTSLMEVRDQVRALVPPTAGTGPEPKYEHTATPGNHAMQPPAHRPIEVSGAG